MQALGASIVLQRSLDLVAIAIAERCDVERQPGNLNHRRPARKPR
jgi:hypothetical protein